MVCVLSPVCLCSGSDSCHKDFQKSGISGNALAVAEMGKNDIYYAIFKIWEKAKHKNLDFKTKLC